MAESRLLGVGRVQLLLPGVGEVSRTAVHHEPAVGLLKLVLRVGVAGAVRWVAGPAGVPGLAPARGQHALLGLGPVSALLSGSEANNISLKCR